MDQHNDRPGDDFLRNLAAAGQPSLRESLDRTSPLARKREPTLPPASAPPVTPAPSEPPLAPTTPAAPPSAGLVPQVASWLSQRLARVASGSVAPANPAPSTQPPSAATTRDGRPRLARRAKPTRSLRRELPAWMFSVAVHGGLLFLLALATLAPQASRAVAEIHSAMIDTSISASQAEELLNIAADPTNIERDLASAENTATPGLSDGLIGGGTPSATPIVAMTTAMAAGVGERTSLPSLDVVSALSGISLKPPSSMLNREIGRGMGGLVAGSVTEVTENVEKALDQLAREILRHVQQHKLTVIWLFDESGSMKDEQQAIKDKFARVTAELTLHADPEHKDSLALTHVIASFGKDLHYQIPQPTADIKLVGPAINQLPVDISGEENTFQAVTTIINRYGGLISDDRRLLLVLITDESGDDSSTYMEDARATAIRRSVPIFVIGRQSLFGRSDVTLPYKDPLTGDMYWPTIKRGPETVDLECLQYDGLHGRWDEQPSGFAPYGLARMTKDSGGIYFLLPSEEDLRQQISQREKAYSMKTLKEYVPDYESRKEYETRLSQSILRRTLYEIIQQTSDYGFRRHFPVEGNALAQAITEEIPKVQQQLALLGAIEKRLRSLEKERDRDSEKRWQAHYDLILAQVAAYQVKAYEYGATLTEMAQKLQKNDLKPSKQPVKDLLVVEWVIDHNQKLRASPESTAKQIDEATRLFKQVIDRHPKSPWADLAQDELNRGFGCQYSEWTHTSKYDERANLVPKY